MSRVLGVLASLTAVCPWESVLPAPHFSYKIGEFYKLSEVSSHSKSLQTYQQLSPKLGLTQ